MLTRVGNLCSLAYAKTHTCTGHPGFQALCCAHAFNIRPGKTGQPLNAYQNNNEEHTRWPSYWLSSNGACTMQPPLLCVAPATQTPTPRANDLSKAAVPTQPCHSQSKRHDVPMLCFQCTDLHNHTVIARNIQRNTFSCAAVLSVAHPPFPGKLDAR